MPETIQNTTQTTWGWLVIMYLFLAGVGAGAYLTSWWATRRDIQGSISVVGRYLAAPLVGVGALLLVFDLGAGSSDLLRLPGLYTRPSSMMSLGTWILTIFLVLSVIDGYGPVVGLRRRAWFGNLTAVFAVFVAIYTGLLLGVVKAVPFWHSALLPVLFVLSACSTGIAASMLGSVVAERRRCDVEPLGQLHQGILIAEGAVLALFLYFAAAGASAAHFSFAQVVGGGYAVAFWIGLVAVGLFAPFTYCLLSRSRALTRSLGSPAWVTLEAVLVLTGGVFLRYLVVVAGAFGHIAS